MTSAVYLTGDTVVTSHPCLIERVAVNGGAAGCAISVYDGLDNTSGRQLAAMDVLAHTTQSIDFHGAKIDRGIFVDVTTEGGYITVIYTYPIPPEVTAT